MSDLPQSRRADIVVREFENETMIYDLTADKVFLLNETSGLVYQISDGTKSIQEIANLMIVKLKTPVSEDLVWFALDQLKKFGLLENADETKDYFGGLTRRQVIRKIGLASMVKLPVISSVIVPKAAAAQSSRANLSPCSSNGQCQSNNCPTNASAVPVCCAAGVGNPSAVNPGDGACTPPGNCGAPFNQTRCCTQGGSTVVPGPNACTLNGSELCKCN